MAVDQTLPYVWPQPEEFLAETGWDGALASPAWVRTHADAQLQVYQKRGAYPFFCWRECAVLPVPYHDVLHLLRQSGAQRTKWDEQVSVCEVLQSFGPRAAIVRYRYRGHNGFRPREFVVLEAEYERGDATLRIRHSMKSPPFACPEDARMGFMRCSGCLVRPCGGSDSCKVVVLVQVDLRAQDCPHPWVQPGGQLAIAPLSTALELAAVAQRRALPLPGDGAGQTGRPNAALSDVVALPVVARSGSAPGASMAALAGVALAAMSVGGVDGSQVSTLQHPSAARAARSGRLNVPDVRRMISLGNAVDESDKKVKLRGSKRYAQRHPRNGHDASGAGASAGDVPLEDDGRALGFDEILQDAICRRYFRRFLDTEFNSETVDFWTAVREVREMEQELGPVQVAPRMTAIVDEFVRSGAERQVNLSEGIRAGIERSIQSLAEDVRAGPTVGATLTVPEGGSRHQRHRSSGASIASLTPSLTSSAGSATSVQQPNPAALGPTKSPTSTSGSTDGSRDVPVPVDGRSSPLPSAERQQGASVVDSVFGRAERAVYDLMQNDPYRRFLESALYQEMLEYHARHGANIAGRMMDDFLRFTTAFATSASASATGGASGPHGAARASVAESDSDAPPSSEEWTALDTVDGCQMHRKRSPGSPYTVLRERKVIAREPLAIVAAIEDLTQLTRWFPYKVASCRTVEQVSQNVTILYLVCDSPAKGQFHRLRDACILQIVASDDQGRKFVLWHSIEHKDCAERKEYMRAHIPTSGWMVEGLPGVAAASAVTALVQIDWRLSKMEMQLYKRQTKRKSLLNALDAYLTSFRS